MQGNSLPFSLPFCILRSQANTFLIWIPLAFQGILLVFQQVICVLFYNCLFFSFFMLVSILIHSILNIFALSLSFLNSSLITIFILFDLDNDSDLDRNVSGVSKEPENLFFLLLALVYQAIKGIKPRSI